MRISKEKIEALLALPDDALWVEAVRLAKSYGITIPERTPSKEEMNKLRDVIGGEKINTGEALKLINNYRRNKSSGK